MMDHASITIQIAKNPLYWASKGPSIEIPVAFLILWQVADHSVKMVNLITIKLGMETIGPNQYKKANDLSLYLSFLVGMMKMAELCLSYLLR